jgi:hypothetical protein
MDPRRSVSPREKTKVRGSALIDALPSLAKGQGQGGLVCTIKEAEKGTPYRPTLWGCSAVSWCHLQLKGHSTCMYVTKALITYITTVKPGGRSSQPRPSPPLGHRTLTIMYKYITSFILSSLIIKKLKGKGHTCRESNEYIT